MSELLTLQTKALLTDITGVDFDEEHTKDTPARWIKMMKELTTEPPFTLTKFLNEDPKVDEMVVVANIPFYSLCAHHIIPFFGKAHVAYVPGKYIVGLSKLARMVKYWSKGLNIQEELTDGIAETLSQELDPVGVGVVMAAEHLCMTMRGVQVPGALTTTSAMRGCFLDPTKQARQEFLALANGRH